MGRNRRRRRLTGEDEGESEGESEGEVINVNVTSISPSSTSPSSSSSSSLLSSPLIDFIPLTTDSSHGHYWLDIMGIFMNGISIDPPSRSSLSSPFFLSNNRDKMKHQVKDVRTCACTCTYTYIYINTSMNA
jgi:hypothetical protein